SLRYPAAQDEGERLIVLESVRRGPVLLLDMDGTNAEIYNFDVRGADGRALPAWVRTGGNGMVVMEPPADAEMLRLVVTAERADGELIQREVEIDLNSGALDPNGSDGGADNGRNGEGGSARLGVPTLTGQIEQAANINRQDSEALARALAAG
ncbi:MAG: hypothetical protein AAF205_07050, partial [Pseudomonadota bacterium]